VTHPESSSLFILDTNVLLHDPASLFRFQEHDLFLPMVVLEELDNNKTGLSEVARNARQASRFIEDLMQGASHRDIEAGLLLARSSDAEKKGGRLYLQTQPLHHDLPSALPGNKVDNTLLAVTLALRAKDPARRVALISKDINLRIKAATLGLSTMDYLNDMALDDLSLLYTGQTRLNADFWNRNETLAVHKLDSGNDQYLIRIGDEFSPSSWHPNQLVYIDNEDHFEGIYRGKKEDQHVIESCVDFRKSRNTVWGINARNREQNFALNLLMDPSIDMVTLLGTAGSGKTLLTLAAGLAQVLDEQRYHEIIMTRVTVPMGEDIGFLPGTEQEKMTPWMGALMDNLEVLTRNEGGKWEQAATNDLLRHRIRINSLNFIRGRTLQKKYFIIDEAQNLSAKQLKALITRAGPGSKVVCLGNIAQIDTPYLTETTSGLTYVVDRFKNWAHSGHVTLRNVERSRLADCAEELL